MRKKATKYRSKKKQSAFTLVELLIVIVIIGILVGLAFSTATAIQNRAKNSVYYATYQNVYKLLQSSLVTNGYIPITSTPADNQVCIGVTKDYDADGLGDCDSWTPDGGTASYDLTHQSVDLELALKTISKAPAGRLPVPFTRHDSSAGGTTTIYNAILHGYTVVPPSSDPSGEMRILGSNKQLAYVFGGPLYGDNQNCGNSSVQFDSVQNISGRLIVYYAYANNEPTLSSSGMTYCLYAIPAL